MLERNLRASSADISNHMIKNNYEQKLKSCVNYQLIIIETKVALLEYVSIKEDIEVRVEDLEVNQKYFLYHVKEIGDHELTFKVETYLQYLNYILNGYKQNGE